MENERMLRIFQNAFGDVADVAPLGTVEGLRAENAEMREALRNLSALAAGDDLCALVDAVAVLSSRFSCSK